MYYIFKMYYICFVFYYTDIHIFFLQVSQPDEKGLETLTSMVIQKFPRLTPQIFVDLSQFIPFMSISDIVSFPLNLLANQSV